MEKTIYKKDSSGKVRYLKISTEGSTLIQESGVIGTPNPLYNASVSKPKNVGRSNETSGAEQAVLEAESKLTLKLRQGYFETEEQAAAEGGADFLLPMLAKDFKKEAKKVKYPCFAQRKYDGMRCLAVIKDNKATLFSRTGKEVITCPHINSQLEILKLGDCVLDGELYSRELGTFQENMKALKKYREGITEKILYNVYDIVIDLPFARRYANLVARIQGTGNPNIEVVPTWNIASEEDLIKNHKDFVADGYEGTIVRHTKVGYEVNKRSSQLLKYKDFIDKAYRVVDVIPSDVRPEQGVVSCYCEKTKETFETGMKFSHAEREEILLNKNKYIGMTAEVRFFEFTDKGLPRFPVCYGFRLDK